MDGLYFISFLRCETAFLACIIGNDGASRSGLESVRPASLLLQQFANGALSETAAAYLVQAVRAAGKCDAVFKGFSDCLLKLGDNMATYPQGLDDKTNIKTVCTYWEDFHSCTVAALTDCQEGAKDMWDKLRKESKNLNIQGSLFELCGSGNGAAGSLLPALPVLLASLSAALATWLSF
ncbi:PREDICTED: neuritin isoform X2 [Hipposideros armiger]|uniref:Neuritin isoform X2 n=1 Tax=Hipposideros armiger TaxID=186990 RepID=A0A8B7PYJ2_HIPAR|nr:PREDICTED: neuritin isoform X2 [Hipposideros armiger]